jgi:hypothetical protein
MNSYHLFPKSSFSLLQYTVYPLYFPSECGEGKYSEKGNSAFIARCRCWGVGEEGYGRENVSAQSCTHFKHELASPFNETLLARDPKAHVRKDYVGE